MSQIAAALSLEIQAYSRLRSDEWSLAFAPWRRSCRPRPRCSGPRGSHETPSVCWGTSPEGTRPEYPYAAPLPSRRAQAPGTDDIERPCPSRPHQDATSVPEPFHLEVDLITARAVAGWLARTSTLLGDVPPSRLLVPPASAADWIAGSSKVKTDLLHTMAEALIVTLLR